MVDAGGYRTWNFTWHFTSLSRLNSLLSANASFCTLSNTNIPTTATADDTFAVVAHSHFVTTTYVLTGHLSFALVPPSATPEPNTAALLQQAYTFIHDHDAELAHLTDGGWQRRRYGGHVHGA